MPRRLIDLHAHFLPDAYRSAAEAAGHAQPDGFPNLPQWDAREHVELMDRQNIGVSLLSISSPGVHFGDDSAARDLARQVNEDGHRALERFPGRFGLFAALPLLALTTLDHLHYGSDYPFTPEAIVARLAEPLEGAGEPAGSLLETLRENSARLFPRLADPGWDLSVEKP